jgi:NTE family protein
VRSYFDLMCADLSKYPVARAVAASSAVPGLLSPIVLENYAGSCGYQVNPWIQRAADGHYQTIERVTGQAMLALLHRDERPWLHLVDGGIADNLGLRAIWTDTEVAGGLDKAFPSLSRPGGHQVLLILVNAIAQPRHEWMFFSKAPSLLEIFGAVSAIELSRFDLDTIQLTQESFQRWAEEASAPDNPVSFDFVEVSFDQVKDEAKRDALNQIGTNFDLKDDDVDLLISSARTVLRESPAFQAFLEANRAAFATRPAGGDAK